MNKKEITLLVLAAFLAGIFLAKQYYSTKKQLPEKINTPELTQLTIPKADEPMQEIKIKPKSTMTLIPVKNDLLYYYTGEFNNNLVKADYVNIGEVIKQFKNKVPENDLMFLIKADSTASFKNIIDILDEMSIGKVPAGHYAEVEITEIEKNYLKSLASK